MARGAPAVETCPTCGITFTGSPRQRNGQGSWKKECPAGHWHTLHALHKDSGPLIVARGEQGFVMSDGTFAGREEAAKAALEAGQITALQWPPNLYTEDLW